MSGPTGADGPFAVPIVPDLEVMVGRSGSHARAIEVVVDGQDEVLVAVAETMEAIF